MLCDSKHEGARGETGAQIKAGKQGPARCPHLANYCDRVMARCIHHVPMLRALVLSSISVVAARIVPIGHVRTYGMLRNREKMQERPHSDVIKSASNRYSSEEKSMSKMPRVPPEQRSNKGPGSDPNVVVEEKIPGRENFDTQGRHGNIKQNTTNQGYQQDR